MPPDDKPNHIRLDLSQNYPMHPDAVGRVVPSDDPDRADSVEQGFLVSDEDGVVRFEPLRPAD